MTAAAEARQKWSLQAVCVEADVLYSGVVCLRKEDQNGVFAGGPE